MTPPSKPFASSHSPAHEHSNMGEHTHMGGAGMADDMHSVDEGQRELMRMAYEAQVFQQQQRLMQQELSMLDNGIRELNMTIAALESLDKAKKETLFSIGGGAFVKSRDFERGAVILNVGAGVLVEKGRGEAILLVKKRIDNAKVAVQKLSVEFGSVVQKLRALEERAQLLQQQMQQ
ncbi:prefoldin subunit alpha [Candidatus Micrarchaeota archaeon CG1_02_49_24]|nr:MAG: prefoldin subunit alpha [Candidatus Micrarchaeota archaeon CG1_02_49_24]